MSVWGVTVCTATHRRHWVLLGVFAVGFADWVELWTCNLCKRKWERER